MSLKLMYITNNIEVAKIAEQAGVDRIFIDMEYVGKAERQPGDTVKSHHTIEDIKSIRAVIKSAEILVRCNPISSSSDDFVGSEHEINAIIEAGANIIMLPMAKSTSEVKQFCDFVGGRVKTVLLLETREAAENIEEILSSCPLDEVHIGLNDLHLSYGMKFMFELLADGTVEMLTKTISKYGLPYGFGGIARIGLGMLPSERVITEHYRLGSGAAILSRSFCNIQNLTDIREIKKIFIEGVNNIRDFEKTAQSYTTEQYEGNRLQVIALVEKIKKSLGG